jgi:hypothetical protein
MDALVMILSLIAAAWMAWRYLRRSIRYVWDSIVSSVFASPSPRYVMPPPSQSRQTEQTDQQTPHPSPIAIKPPRYAVDRTRQAVLDELLTHGWTIADLRREGILRGDNAVIGQEVAESRERLGLAEPDRKLIVRDTKGERAISF